jgi:hypothetical protein
MVKTDTRCLGMNDMVGGAGGGISPLGWTF